MGVIYKCTCQITGKHYIGQTTRSLEERRHEHLKLMKNQNYPFYLALRKYGVENFVWSILEECDNSVLNDREVYWIAYYDTYNHGYNATKGGDNADALINWKKDYPEQVREYALQNLKKANAYNQEHREKQLSQLATARPKAIAAVKKKVRCIELNLEFEGIADAERWSQTLNNPNGKKASHQHISHVCKGSRKTAGGYHWEYVAN